MNRAWLFALTAAYGLGAAVPASACPPRVVFIYPAREERPRSLGEIKVAQAMESTYYGKWKTGELLAKYCNRPSWRYDATKDRVEFRGVLKKGGAELVARFQVYYDWVDKSNTRKGWVVVDDGATLGGKELLIWKPQVFVDEYRLMAGGKNEK